MARWTERQVLDAAPDDASVRAARKLAVPGPWSETGSTDALVWGQCQGSGKTPYQVSIDLTGPAYRCSCPSRKFPCKHALALLLLWVSGGESIGTLTTPAGHAAEWAGKRAANAAAGAQRRAAKPPDPEAQARRREERLALMSAGMDDFALWLGDLARAGMAAARQRPYSSWDEAAARLVDAQLPGLAEQVRDTGAAIHGRSDWVEHLLVRAGRWWAATHAWRGRDDLTPDQFGDLRAFLGWAIPSEEVRATGTIADDWAVVGAHRSDDGRLQQQRTWLWGETSHELVQLLDFAARGEPLPVARLVGSVLTVEIARYPGTLPRRALLATEPVAARSTGSLPAPGTIGEALARIAEVGATNPWAPRVPLLLSQVRISTTEIHDGQHSLPLRSDQEPWLALALTGGAPVDVFAEWETDGLRLLTAAVGAELVPL